MKNATRIVIILDRSGSMNTARESTIKGINKFVQEQKEVKGEASIKLVQFDDNGLGLDYQTVFDTNIKDVRKLTQKDFEPRGGTPLLDAQGKAITELGNELSTLPESDRPDKVLVVTITDGLENSSREYSADKIKQMIRHQTDKYNWDFVYLGANQDAVAVGTGLGMMAGKTMSYSVADPAAVGSTYTNLSSYTRRARSAVQGQAVQDNTFTEQERSSSLTGEEK